MQKVLMMLTSAWDLRSKAYSWVAEDGDVAGKTIHHCIDEFMKVNSGAEVPFEKIFSEQPVEVFDKYESNPGNEFYHYATPLHAIGRGWKLLAPPKSTYVDHVSECYEWWFVKD